MKCLNQSKGCFWRDYLKFMNEQIEQVNVGDTIKITNGYVSEFQGEMQLTTGKIGKLEIVSKSDKQEPVYTNAPQDVGEKQVEDLSKEVNEELSEEPVDDEEYIG